ncbi:hypothetical protein HELRODRAFT_191234 [Helobdella robusta]|uniref:Poly [ADP-ribose] polymerase n=1 Tax=Helobdella robusta TaxID=6412 RepID=T1FSR8_HELRO|nr:hypothetical protein HELRODRAFT_191234 [Helobdella robusta]ESO06899.1 hypothetical protein HELRODRAFT_191234 [Helobdella robusta]
MAENNNKMKKSDEDFEDSENELESYNLVINNIPRPSQITSHKLREWLIKVTSENNIKVTTSGISHFAHFTSATIGVEEMMDILRNSPYEGTHLEVDEVKIIKRLHVKNLREDVTEDEIVLYFEQPKFHPNNLPDDADFFVSVLHLDKKKKFAFIKLPDVADLNIYINATHSDILGENLKVSDGKLLKKRARGQRKPQHWQQHQRKNMNDKSNNLKTSDGHRAFNNSSKSRDHSAESQRSEHYRGRARTTKLVDIDFDGDFQRTNLGRMSKSQILHHQQHHHHQQQQQHHYQQYRHQHHHQQPHQNHQPSFEFYNKKVVYVEDEQRNEKRELLRKFLKVLTKTFGSDWMIWIDLSNPEIHLGHSSDEEKLQKVADHIKELLMSAVSCEVNFPRDLADVCSVNYNLIRKGLIDLLDWFKVPAVPFLNASGTLSVLAENQEVATKTAKMLEEDYKDRYITVKGNQCSFPVDNFSTPKWEKFVTGLSRKFLVTVTVDADDSENILISVGGLKSDRGFKRAVDEIRREVDSMGNAIVSVVGDAGSEDYKWKYKDEKVHDRNREFDDSTENDCTFDWVTKSADHNAANKKTIIKLSSLEFRFLKRGLPNVVTLRCYIVLINWCRNNNSIHYNFTESCLEIFGSEVNRNEKKKIIEETMSSFIRKDFHFSIPGITYNFYKEDNSPLKSLLISLEKDKKCALDVKAGDTGSDIVVQCVCGYNAINSMENTLTKALMRMIDERTISYSFILKKSADVCFEGDTQSLDNEKSESIILKGRKMYVSKVETIVNNLFLNYLKKVPLYQEEVQPTILTLDSPLRRTNPSKFFRLFGHQDILAPSHWISHQGSLRTHSDTKGVLNKLDERSTLYNLISCMVYDSWSDDGTFLFDANSSSKESIKIENIYAVENVYQYKRYMTKINEFCLQNHDKISGLSQQTRSVHTRRITDNEPTLLHEINECYLFHGTDRSNKQAIVDQGLDFRLGSTASLFGKGIYFAESCTKAHYYAVRNNFCTWQTDSTDSGSNWTDSPFCIFVTRVFLGNVHCCDKAQPFKRPPCMDASCKSDTCHQHPLCDSVLGTNSYNERMQKCISLRKERDDIMTSTGVFARAAKLSEINENLRKHSRYLFREFIVYDQSQCYPEFLVEYKKLNDNNI